MAGIDRAQIEKSLRRKGFVQEPGGKHMRWFYWRDGKKTGVSVEISSGKQHQTYGDDLILYLKKQLQLDTMKQAREFLLCPMEQETYEAFVGPKMRW